MITDTQLTIYKVLAIALFAATAISSPAIAQSSFTEQEVSFKNGSVELSGTYMTPEGEGKFPAIVFLHGSGPHQRAGFRPYAEEFAKLGIASLYFDKRGSGKSGGSWTTSSLNDIAGDVLTDVEF